MVGVTGDVIVVGLDGSESSSRALAWAITEAERSARSLVLVHAWHWTQDVLASPTPEPGWSEARKAGRSLLDRAAAQSRKRGVSTSTKLVDGSAAEGLTKSAEGAAMLVVGSHGRRSFAKVFLGSVSTACIQHAVCPVVIVAPERDRNPA